VVVADAGPLIALGRIGRLDLLRPILGEVLAPEAVLAECLVEPLRPGALAIVDAVARGWLHRTPDPRPQEPPFPILGLGESAAIRLALAAAVPVSMDDRAGRSVARNLGVAVIGTGGVVLAAKQRGLIDAVARVLEALRANGYHLSTALVQAILDRAGEAPEHL
jgi:predicted nucleic acid-binding protein